jgi:hypothetical protein
VYDLVYFSAHCVALGHSPGYIKSTMCSVGYTFETATGINPTKTMYGVTHPILARFLLGVTKLRSNFTRPRLPMTVPLLCQFLEKLSHNIASYLVAYRAALAIAVFGMLRTGEFTSDTIKFFDPTKGITKLDVKFDRDDSAAEITIRWAKTAKFRQTQIVTICATGQKWCPVKLLRAWFRIRTASDHLPLFTMNDGSYMTRIRLATVIKTTAPLVGLKPSEVNTYSCRAGGAISASASGCGHDILAIAGRWQSTCYLRYVQHIQRSTVQSLHKKMAAVSHADITAKDQQVYASRFDA